MFRRENLVKERCLYLQLKQTKMLNGSTLQAPTMTAICKKLKNNKMIQKHYHYSPMN
jgi:hypothetical protein